MSNILAKKYYRIEFEVLSPLSVGSGNNNETDSDIMLDSLGNPYIAGSSLAGVYRRILGKDESERYFGKLLVGTNDIDESSVITYDATLDKKDGNTGNPYIGKRDMVALDEYKVAKDGAKFDFQILEPGVTMVTYIETNIYEDKVINESIDKILSTWINTGISFGAKTKRGYGLTRAKDIKEAYFFFLDAASKENWIDFDLYNASDKNWKDYEVLDKQNLDAIDSKYIEVKLALHLVGGLSIREYSTRVKEADYVQMKLHSDNKIAVIPGTSWAGAFRSQMKKLGASEEELTDVFGAVKKEGKKSTGHQSKISFSESYMNDGVDIIYSRNAIDRFSGGTIDGALYTESTRYNGSTELVIRIDTECVSKISAYLAASIIDLHNGYMAVGGLTAVGRGLFEITKCTINGSNVEINGSDEETNYNKIREALA